MGRNEPEVIVVENEGGSLKWLLLGAAVGAGLALLFAPRSGKEVRRELGRGLRSLRDLADDTLDELKGEGAAGDEADLRSMADAGGAYDAAGEDTESAAEAPRRPKNRPSQVSARDELERRLAAARARRRQPVPDEDEEPVA